MDRASQARKAGKAKLQKLANEWEKRLQRMGMGDKAAMDNHDHSIGYNGTRHSTDYTPAQPINCAYFTDLEVAEVFAEETGVMFSGRRAFEPGLRHPAPIMRRGKPAEPKRFWPNAEETHVNYRAAVVGGVI
jgi:hypothetical protein